jgi:hypothetical protein
MGLAYLSTLLSNWFGPDSVRSVLLGGTFFSEVVVAIAILAESKFDTCKGWIIAISMVAGISVGVYCTIALFTYDESISAEQQLKIADLDAQLVARTKELLAVRRLTADRTFTVEERKSVISALSAFSGQQAKIVVFPVNFESSFAADQIFSALSNAHWRVDPPEKLFKPPNGSLTQGIDIIPADDIPSLNAANALFEALKTTGVSGHEEPGKQSIPDMSLFDHSKPMVWVFVGDKPNPLLDWIKP